MTRGTHQWGRRVHNVSQMSRQTCREEEYDLSVLSGL